MVLVSRPINGITINGDGEFLMDDDGIPMEFDGEEAAKDFLKENGISDEEIEYMNFHEVIGRCRRCDSPLIKSFLEGYHSQCLVCDEDFYEIEQYRPLRKE